MSNDSTFGVTEIVEMSLYTLGYIGIAIFAVILLIWIILLWTFVRENQRKIRTLLKMRESERYREIAIVKCDTIKFRLMIVVLVFELLTCLALDISLLGAQLDSEIQTFHRAVLCQSFFVKLECKVLLDATAINVLFLCMGGYMATLALYLAKKFMDQNGNTRIIRYMTVFILIQVIVCLPLDLAEQFIVNYFYAAFNTINFILLLKGCFRLRKLLRWRRQDCNFTRYHARSQKIEKRYNLQMYTLITIYGLIFSMDNLNLVVRNGILLQLHGSSAKIGGGTFQILRYLMGIIWMLSSFIIYSAVLFSYLLSRMKSPKYTRYHVYYPANALHQPLLLKGVK